MRFVVGVNRETLIIQANELTITNGQLCFTNQAKEEIAVFNNWDYYLTKEAQG